MAEKSLKSVDSVRSNIIKDTPPDLKDEVNGQYRLLKDKIKNLQRQIKLIAFLLIISSIAPYLLPSSQTVQNERLSRNLEMMQRKLDEVQNEIRNQKEEITKLNGKNEMLVYFNGQINMKFGEMDHVFNIAAGEYKQMSTKFNDAVESQLQITDELQANLNLSNSNFDQLKNEMENLKLEKTNVQVKIKELMASQETCNHQVKAIFVNVQEKLNLAKNNVEQLENELEKVTELVAENGFIIKATEDKVIKLENDFANTKCQTFIQQNVAIAKQLSQYKSHSFTWKINGIAEIAKHNGFSVESEVFQLIGYPFKARAMFSIEEDGYAFVSLAFIDGKNMGKLVPLKIYPQVTFTLKDLDGTEKDITRTVECLFSSSLKFDHFYYEEWLKHKSKLVNVTYNRNNSIVIDIAIDPPSVANVIVPNDGMLTSTIDNYSLRKQRAVEGLEYFYSSPHFYTSPSGFRVKVNMHLNGHGDYTAKGISADVLFLTGEYDSDLGLPFPHQTTVVIFNQLDSTKHYIHSTNMTIENDRNYLIDVLTHEEIEKEGFLKDDTLYFKIIIKAL